MLYRDGGLPYSVHAGKSVTTQVLCCCLLNRNTYKRRLVVGCYCLPIVQCSIWSDVT